MCHDGKRGADAPWSLVAGSVEEQDDPENNPTGEADEVEDEGWFGGCISLASCAAGNNARS